VDVQLINPFVCAAGQVFKTMLGCQVTPGKAEAVARLEHRRGTVDAIVAMEGGATGALVLRVSSRVVQPVAAALDGGDPEGNVEDAIGELASMITGVAKKSLKTHLVRISVPTVARDPSERAIIARLRPWLVVPFSCPFGPFALAVSFRADPAASHRPTAGPAD